MTTPVLWNELPVKLKNCLFKTASSQCFKDNLNKVLFGAFHQPKIVKKV